MVSFGGRCSVVAFFFGIVNMGLSENRPSEVVMEL